MPLTQAPKLTRRRPVSLDRLGWRALGTLFRNLQAEVEAGTLDAGAAGERYARMSRAYRRQEAAREASAGFALSGIDVPVRTILGAYHND